jgi:hypothetical protein
MADQLAQDAVMAVSRLRTNRMNWEGYWQNCAELVQPSMSMTFFNNLIVEGQQKDQKRYDGTAEIALGRFASAMESILTPRNQLWHGLATSDSSLNRRPRVRAFFDAATEALFKYRYDSAANFASQCNEHYMSLGLLGTGATFIDKLQAINKPRGFRYMHIHLGWIFFDQNHQGITDSVYRPFKMKARNCVEKFKENCPENIRLRAIANPDELFDIIHCVHPNYDRDPKRKDWRGMNYMGYYVAQTEQTVIEMSGYNTFPYCISRYQTAPGEMYGRSPAMQALTNIRTLNQQKKTHLKQGQRTVEPVLLMHDDGAVDFSMKPGAMNPGMINSRGQRLVDVLPTGNLSINERMMEMEKEEIKAAFLTDLFQILVDSPSRMTTVEVMERAKEKGILMSPTMGRQESEFLGPMIEREMDLAMMQGILPPLPPELQEAGGEYKIVYNSPLARAQKAEQAAGTMRTVQWASEVSQMTQDPSPLDNFNFDVIIPDLAYNQAVPQAYMATPEMIAQKRQARQQQQATNQVIQAGPSVAAIASKSQTAANS